MADHMEFENVAAACQAREFHLVKYMLQDGFDVDAVESEQRHTALHWAAWYGNSGVVADLIGYRANIDVVSADGAQPVHLAARQGQLGVMGELWRHDNTVICRGNSEWATPAHLAAQCGYVHLLEWLYLKGIPINTQDEFGMTPLHYAVYEGHTLCTQLLLQCGVFTMSVDIEGRTPLHWIAIRARGILVPAMLRIRPDAFDDPLLNEALDSEGKSAQQLSPDPCLGLQLAALMAWRKTRHLSFPWNTVPRHPVLALNAICLPILHILNVSLTIVFIIKGYLASSRFTYLHALELMGLFVSQGLSLWHWSEASLSNPGYCESTSRLDVESLGPDGHERLVRRVQHELNDLVRLKRERSSELVNSDSCDLQGAGQPDPTLDGIESEISRGKERLANVLLQASCARLQLYPTEYATLACSVLAETEPNSWGKKACVVCGRLRTQRSKHCNHCGRCVSIFDHHCPWLGNCVGANNLGVFLRFLACTFIALLLEHILSMQFLVDIPVLRSTEWSTSRVLVKINMVLNGVFGFAVGSLLARQIVLAMAGMTEYETNDKSVLRTMRALSWNDIVNNVAVVLFNQDLSNWVNEPVSKSKLTHNEPDIELCDTAHGRQVQ